MRKIVITLLVLILAFVFVSCNPETLVSTEGNGYGSLSIVADRDSFAKTIEPDYLSRKCTSYEIFIRALTFEYETSVKTASKSFVMDEVKAGEYEVYVEGVNESGVHIVTSEKKTVSIRNRITTEVEFSLNKYTSGTGVFSLTMVVPKNDLQVCGVAWALKSLTDEDSEIIVGSETESSLSADEKYRRYTINSPVPAGSYDVEVVMFDQDVNQVGFTHVDSVHVFRDSTSSSSYVWDKEFFPAIPSPSFDLTEGVYSEGQIVRIISEDPRAELFYTLDGSEPTTESNLYVNPIVLSENTEIKAMAYVEGLRSSESVSRTYTVKVSTPVLSIKDQSVVDYDDLVITTSTPGARIIYTLDGTDPSDSNGTEYSEPILIYQNLTVKAIAIKDNHESSEIVAAEYFDVNSPSPSRFFSITSNGAVSANKSLLNTLPSVLIIPEEINGIEVSSLDANAFRACSSVKTIVIPNSVSSIGSNAFTGCSSISSIVVSEFVTSISSTAFNGWTENQIINDYSGLIRAGSLTNCSAKIYATIKMGTQIVGGYTGMYHLYGIYLPNSVTTIEKNAFSGCVNLNDFVMPPFVTSIGELAFYGCTSISQVTLPSVLKSVSYDSFNDWTSQQKIIDRSGLLALQRMTECYAKIYTTVPKSVNNVPVDGIPASFSRGRDDIYGLEIPSNVKYIESYAFEGTSIEEITIPATVEEMGLEIFKGWNDSQKVHYVYNQATISVSGTQTTFTGNAAAFDVEFASNFTSIKADAFAGMAGLTEISIPSSVTTIGNRAFRNTAIRTVAISDNVTNIGENCFYGCSKLETISFGNGLQTIGESAFENCIKLVRVILPNSVETIGDRVFSNCALLESVNLGEGVSSIPKYAFINSPRLTELTAPNCMGSFSLVVRLPLEQLIAKKVEISIVPSYASIPGYTAVLDRQYQSIEGGYRVFTFYVGSLPGIEYTAEITLKDSENTEVGSYISESTPVTAGNTTSVTKAFTISDLATRTLTLPVFSKTAGTYEDGAVLEINDQDSEIIIYTLDGTNPTELNGIEYTEPIVLDRTETIKAIGIKEGYRYSSVKSAAYTVKVCTPQFSVEPGYTYTSTQVVFISSDTEGAELHYTLDGTTPNQNSPVYSEPLIISSTTTVKVIGYKNGLSASTVRTGVYTINIPDHIIVTPVNYSLAITTSVDMVEDSIEGEVTFGATLNPSSNNASYVWYLDGDCVSHASTFHVGNGAIEDGYHLLELKAYVDGTSYSDLLLFDYSKAPTLSITTSVNMEGSTIKGAVTFTANLELPNSNATYSWLLDGHAVSNTRTYSVGNGLISNGNHSLKVTAVVNGRSYSKVLQFNYVKIACSYTVDLNNQWRKSTSVSNPNTSLYDGVYESYYNYNVNSRTATMRIKVSGYTTFRIYVRSYAESSCDYVRVYSLDNPTSVLVTTSGKQNSGTAISSYTAVDFTIPDDGKEHVITIDYYKDYSKHSGYDRGYLLIPKNQ